MVSSNANALGVIFANSYDNLVPELVAERTMASIPFAGRYRMIDFVLSNMANAGVDNVSVIVRKNYHSLMDHLGAGREWDLTRKRGGLNIVPPFAERSIKLYSGRVDALASVLNWLRDQKERYVILSDSNIAMNFDFNKLIEAHVKSGADVTMVYNRGEIPDGARTDNYTIRIDNGRCYGRHCHQGWRKGRTLHRGRKCHHRRGCYRGQNAGKRPEYYRTRRCCNGWLRCQDRQGRNGWPQGNDFQ